MPPGPLLLPSAPAPHQPPLPPRPCLTPEAQRSSSTCLSRHRGPRPHARPSHVLPPPGFFPASGRPLSRGTTAAHTARRLPRLSPRPVATSSPHKARDTRAAPQEPRRQDARVGCHPRPSGDVTGPTPAGPDPLGSAALWKRPWPRCHERKAWICASRRGCEWGQALPILGLGLRRDQGETLEIAGAARRPPAPLSPLAEPENEGCVPGVLPPPPAPP